MAKIFVYMYLNRDSSKNNIVMIDDDEFTLEYLKHLVKFEDCALQLFDCAEQALQEVVLRKTDLLLVDFRMPKICGIEFLSQLTIQNGHLPTKTYLLTSSLPPEHTSKQAQTLGVEILLKDTALQRQWLLDQIG
jgi:response regulator RpfG family c-di-GMP phosphodiesterase